MFKMFVKSKSFDDEYEMRVIDDDSDSFESDSNKESKEKIQKTIDHNGSDNETLESMANVSEIFQADPACTLLESVKCF
jgi:hypothetical protein